MPSAPLLLDFIPGRGLIIAEPFLRWRFICIQLTVPFRLGRVLRHSSLPLPFPRLVLPHNRVSLDLIAAFNPDSSLGFGQVRFSRVCCSIAERPRRKLEIGSVSRRYPLKDPCLQVTSHTAHPRLSRSTSLPSSCKRGRFSSIPFFMPVIRP